MTSCEDIVIESSNSDSLLFGYQTQWIKRLLQNTAMKSIS